MCGLQELLDLQRETTQRRMFEQGKGNEMTYLEKAMEIEFEGEKVDKEMILDIYCPCSFNLEDDNGCKSTDRQKCAECWNREIPNTDKSILLSIGENYESSVVKKIKEQEEKMVKDIVSECLNNTKPQFSNPVIEKAYNTGLNDAWELARKLNDMKWEELEKIFVISDSFYEIIRTFTPQEALAKLKAYEETQIEVGDVVECNYHKIVITSVCGEEVAGIDDIGATFLIKMERCKKTGKHIDIQSILESIGE